MYLYIQYYKAEIKKHETTKDEYKIFKITYRNIAHGNKSIKEYEIILWVLLGD